MMEHMDNGKPPTEPHDGAEAPPAGEADAPASLTAEQVFREHLPRVYRLARHLVGNDADAEDVVQDVFVQLIRNLSSFRGESAFTTWLHHVTVNAALAQRRKKRAQEAHRVHEPADDFLESGSYRAPVRRWSAAAEKIALDHETQRLIESAIARMSEPYRDVYVLSDVEGIPNAEIGTMLGLSLPAVKSRLHRARLMMREALAPYFEEAAP
jgi:RNA polymerase sigma-70 factor (ECF subfamily)